MGTDLTGYQQILLFGGSFDPPHRAHILLPQQVAQAIGADLIAYIPAGRAPHKLDREQTDPTHRLAMLRLALRGQEGTIPTTILTDEIDRGPDRPSYTVDTLEAIRKRVVPSTTLRLLIGADQLRIFDQWREPERVVALAQPVVMVRPPDSRASLLSSLPAPRREPWRDRFVDVDAMDLSSTQVREHIAAGQPVDDLIDAKVSAYIREHGLYHASAT